MIVMGTDMGIVSVVAARSSVLRRWWWVRSMFLVGSDFVTEEGSSYGISGWTVSGKLEG